MRMDVLGLLLFIIIAAWLTRYWWDKDYRDGYDAASKSKAWSNGYDAGSKGCLLAIAMFGGAAAAIATICRYFLSA
jgi:hypothetical protein